MKRHVRTLALLLAGCFVTGHALAQQVSIRADHKPTPPPSRASVLYDQTADVTDHGTASQDFEAEFDAVDNMAADDFTIGAGETWSVEGVVALGLNQGIAVPSVNVWFYYDDNGMPGMVACEYLGAAVEDDGGGNLTITLDAPCVLGEGTWWVSVQADMDFATNGQWFWFNQGHDTGHAGMWQNPGGGFGVGCTTWTVLTQCIDGAPANDLAFQILGTMDDDGGGDDGWDLTLVDEFGFIWNLEMMPFAGSPKCEEGYRVRGEILNAYPEGSVTGLVCTSTVGGFFRATNEASDNCASFSDFFEYTIQFMDGEVIGGEWVSFCFPREVINKGTWTGTLTEHDGDDDMAVTRVSGGAAPTMGRAAAKAASAKAAPAAFALAQNQPNPFNPSTSIRFELPEASAVRLVVYDVMGREVARLVDGTQEAGVHEVTFDAAQLPSGLYLYRLEAGSFVQTKSMLLLK